MRAPIRLPVLALWPDRDTQQTYQYIEAQVPVDFTATLGGIGYSAAAMILRCGTVVWRGVPDLDALGNITLTVPAAEALGLRGPLAIDATLQINVSAPLPDLALCFLAPISVHEVFA